MARPTPQGHRFYKHPDYEALAIADNSGGTPDTTDDGPLWLDASRDAEITVTGTGFVVVAMPVHKVIDGYPEDRTTYVTIADLRWLLKSGHWAACCVSWDDSVLLLALLARELPAIRTEHTTNAERAASQE